MNGILQYAAPRARTFRGTTLGIASTCIASAVYALPAVVSVASALLQREFARPGASGFNCNIGLLMVLVPTLATLILPVVGTCFGALSIAISRRSCDAAMVGLVVNIGALLAGWGSVFLR